MLKDKTDIDNQRPRLTRGSSRPRFAWVNAGLTANNRNSNERRLAALSAAKLGAVGAAQSIVLIGGETVLRVEVLVLSMFLLTSCTPVRHETPTIPKLPPIVSFQIQYTGEIDTSVDVDVFNLDLFDTLPATIQALRERGMFVMCYFSAGSYEDWRPDVWKFPPEVLGKDMEGWPGEKWLDIRRLDILGPIMEARLDLAVEKGCDGVDPDNVNGYENDTGFPLTSQDQLVYNRFLSTAAHRRGLAIGLKNDIEQAADLVSDFEWILNESCFSYGECHYLLPFREARKPVFVIEYDREPEEICPQANQMGFNALIKHRELDAYRIDCHQFSTGP